VKGKAEESWRNVAPGGMVKVRYGSLISIRSERDERVSTNEVGSAVVSGHSTTTVVARAVDSPASGA